MGLGSLFKAAVGVVTLPIAVAKDVISLGDADATSEKLEEIANDLDEIFE